MPKNIVPETIKKFTISDYDREYKKNHAEMNRKHTRKAQLKRMYGITVDQYNELFERQKGRCAICGKHQSKMKTRLAVDHDHKTNEIRGLLCFSCNMALGYAKDSPGLLLKMALYLKQTICKEAFK